MFFFRYLPSGPWVLEGVSLDLPLGKKMAIVGPSGAGKSTFINLLMRFWDYQEGHILLGGCEIKEVDPERVREYFAVVPQRIYFFHAILRENLLLARPGLTMEEVEERARELGLHEDILSLPQGYETPLGDRGFLLSGGQRQRLALLRALLEGSPVFLLDEPTASLEPLAARDLFYRFLDLVEGKSLILITHRPLGLDLG